MISGEMLVDLCEQGQPLNPEPVNAYRKGDRYGAVNSQTRKS